MSLTNNSDLLEKVQTKASLLEKNEVIPFEAKVFETYKPKLNSKIDTTNQEKYQNKTNDFDNLPDQYRKNNKKSDSTEFDIKRARHEVINFAISGSNHQDKKAAKIALAIKLGAKPPKNAYRNYKEMLNEKQLKKLEEENAGKLSLIGKNQYGASLTKCFKKKPRKVVTQISKHYGVAKPNLKKKK